MTTNEQQVIEYEVTWLIEVEAESPEAAAAIALDIVRDPEGDHAATFFNVKNVETGEVLLDIDGVDGSTFSRGASTE